MMSVQMMAGLSSSSKPPLTSESTPAGGDAMKALEEQALASSAGEGEEVDDAHPWNKNKRSRFARIG